MEPILRPRAARAVRVTCTVRGCGLELARGERAWTCSRGHAFDVARSGYVNLLQPGHRRSLAAGDAREAVAARERLEERGLGAEVRAALVDALAERPPAAAAGALDVGACTGLALERLAARYGLEPWALDLSAAAADRGARRRPGLTWVVANADRGLPFADGAFEVLVSSLGPKNPAEFGRVLAPDGRLLVVVPGPDDLVELRAALLGEGRLPPRGDRALGLFEERFACRARTPVRTRRRLDRAELADLLASAYRGARPRERERLAGLDELEVTLSAELLVLEPR